MQIIVFTLDDQYYSLDSSRVEEISRQIPSTMVPNAPVGVVGLINLRGNVVPLVNLAKLLHRKEDQCYNNIVIVQKEDEKIGILVHEVKEVLKIDESHIEEVSAKAGTGIVGIIQLGDKLVNHIDLDRIL
jgi:purine-binding chemotaxis protein CheW